MTIKQLDIVQMRAVKTVKHLELGSQKERNWLPLEKGEIVLRIEKG